MAEHNEKKIKERVLIWGVLYATAMYSHPQQTNNSVLNVTPLKKKTNDKIGIQRVNYIVKEMCAKKFKVHFPFPKAYPLKKKKSGISLG